MSGEEAVSKIPNQVLINTIKLRTELNIREISPFCDADGEDYSKLEHLIHEMAHATLLRIPCEPGMSRKVGDILAAGTYQERALNEAWCFIIEYLVFQKLEISGMCWDTCVCEAVVQEGVTEDMMRIQRELWETTLHMHAGVIHLMLTARTG